MKPKPIMDIVIYHNNCMDGFTAAAIATLSDHSNTNRYSALIPGDYTKPILLEVLADKHVCFVDYSCKTKEMLAILAVAKSVTVIDHHIGIHDEMASINHPNFSFVYDVNKSGAQLAWDYFVGTDEPWFVQLIGDRDLWKKQFPQADILNLALRTEKYDIDKIRNLLEKIITGATLGVNHDTYELIKMGMSYNMHYQSIIEDIAVHAYSARLDDEANTSVLKVNCPLGFMSDVGAVLAKMSPSGVAWLYYDLGNTVKHSLRVSKTSEYDASVYCKTKGGGGHTKAAGWSSDIRVAELMPDFLRQNQKERGEFGKQFIKTPFDSLNKSLSGGLLRGEVTGIIGNTGSYKSGLNTYLYLGAVIANKNLYAPVGARPTVLRVITDTTPATDIQQQHRNLYPETNMGESITTNEMKNVTSVLKQNGIDTHVMYVASRTLTLTSLSEQLKSYKDLNSPIQAIFIDDALSFMLKDNNYLNYSILVDGLKKLAKMYNIVIVLTLPAPKRSVVNPAHKLNRNLHNIDIITQMGIKLDTSLYVDLKRIDKSNMGLVITINHPDPTLENHELILKLNNDALLVDAKFDIK